MKIDETKKKNGSEWTECKLGEVVTVVCGATPSTSVPEYWGNEINWVTAKDISGCNSHYIYETERKISQLGFENCSTVLLPKNTTVLIARGATMGKSSMIASPMALNQTCYALIANDKTLAPAFLYYLTRELFEYFQGIAHGAIFNTVVGASLRDTSILLPPLPEQRAIEGVLSSLDDKIDLLHRQNRTLEAMAEALFRRWFVEEADEGHTGRIDEIVEFNPPRTLSKGTLAPYLEMANVNSSVFHPDQWYDREFSSGMRFVNGDTLLARITPCLENGKSTFVTFLQEGQVGWGSTEFIVMHPKGALHPLFAYALAKNKDFRDYAEGCLEGSSGRQRVDLDHLMQYEVFIPNDITMFNSIMNSVEPRLHHNFMQIRNLEKLRDMLSPKLMSGEVRVKINE